METKKLSESYDRGIDHNLQTEFADSLTAFRESEGADLVVIEQAKAKVAKVLESAFCSGR